MKNKRFYFSLLLLMFIFLSSIVCSSALTIEGGSLNGTPAGAGNNMQMFLSSLRWKTLGPINGSHTIYSFDKNLNEVPYTFGKTQAVSYLSCSSIGVGRQLKSMNQIKKEVFKGRQVENFSITNRTDGTSVIKYEYMFGGSQKLDCILISVKHIEEENGRFKAFHYKAGTYGDGKLYQVELFKSTKANSDFVSWANRNFSGANPTMSKTALSQWHGKINPNTNEPIMINHLTEIKDLNIWDILQNGLSFTNSVTGNTEEIPPIVGKKGSAIYGSALEILQQLQNGSIVISKDIAGGVKRDYPFTVQIFKTGDMSTPIGVSLNSDGMSYSYDPSSTDKNIKIRQGEEITINNLPFDGYTIKEVDLNLLSEVYSDKILYEPSNSGYIYESSPSFNCKITNSLVEETGTIIVHKKIEGGESNKSFEITLKKGDKYLSMIELPSEPCSSGIEGHHGTYKYSASGFSDKVSTANIKPLPTDNNCTCSSTEILNVPVGVYNIKDTEDRAAYETKYSSETIEVKAGEVSEITITNKTLGSPFYVIRKQLRGAPSDVNNDTQFSARVYLEAKSHPYWDGGRYYGGVALLYRSKVYRYDYYGNPMTYIAPYKYGGNKVLCRFEQIGKNKYKLSKNGDITTINFSVNDPAMLYAADPEEVTDPETGEVYEEYYMYRQREGDDSYVEYITVSEINTGKFRTLYQTKSGRKTDWLWEKSVDIVNVYQGEVDGEEECFIPTTIIQGDRVFEHPCNWQLPPPQRIESRASITRVTKIRDSEINGEESVDIYKAPSRSAEEIFNNPVTEVSDTEISRWLEHEVNVNLEVEQVLVQKHTYYTLNPSWENCTVFDRWKHDIWDWRCRWGNSQGVCTHYGPCISRGWYCILPDGTRSYCNSMEEPCFHPLWIEPEGPQWIENVEFNIVGEKTEEKVYEYSRIKPEPVYEKLLPLNLATKGNVTQEKMSSLINGPYSSSKIQGTINLFDNRVKGDALIGLNNNSPVIFSVEFPNEQFGIPKDIYDIKSYHPGEYEQPYEEQYYWNGSMTFASNAEDITPEVTSLELAGDLERTGRVHFRKSANSGFTGGTLGFRSIYANPLGITYKLGCEDEGAEYWKAKFNYGLYYRYGVIVHSKIKLSPMEDGLIVIPFEGEKHCVPVKSTQNAQFPPMLFEIWEENKDDLYTAEITSIATQPILYGEFDIKTTGGYN